MFRFLEDSNSRERAWDSWNLETKNCGREIPIPHVHRIICLVPVWVWWRWSWYCIFASIFVTIQPVWLGIISEKLIYVHCCHYIIHVVKQACGNDIMACVYSTLIRHLRVYINYILLIWDQWNYSCCFIDVITPLWINIDVSWVVDFSHMYYLESRWHSGVLEHCQKIFIT